MRALIFIQNLKQTLIELDDVSQRHFMFQSIDYELSQNIKSYALIELKKIENIDEFYKDLKYFSQDLLNRDNFNKRLRYCKIKLNEFAIPENKWFDYIKEAINCIIYKSDDDYNSKKNKTTIDELFIDELSNCFQHWYYPEDIFKIEFAIERQLLNLNPISKNWNISNIGNYFLKSSVFEAISFLCALEIVLTSDAFNSKFLSKEMLYLLLRKNNNTRNNRNSRPHTLKLFSLISDNSYNQREELLLTDFGKKVLTYVSNNLDEFSELILLLMEAETVGFKFENQTQFSEFITYIDNCKFLLDDIKNQIKSALQFYNSSKYIEALRIIYPILESVLNLGLTLINLKPSDFKGMRGKVEKLEKENMLSLKVSSGLEIFESRNKVLHGNLIENDNETGKPLFELVVTYLRKVIENVDKNIKNR